MRRAFQNGISSSSVNSTSRFASTVCLSARKHARNMDIQVQTLPSGLRRLSGPFSGGGGGYYCHDDGRARDVVASELAEHPGRFLDEPIPVGRDMTD